MAEGTIYRHFDDKYALFHEIFLALAGDIVAELARFPERAGQGTVRDNLEHLLGPVGRLVEHTASLMASMWADPEVARSFAAYVQERAPEGLECSMERAMNEHFPKPADFPAPGPGALDILARGLAPLPGRANGQPGAVNAR